MQESDFKLSWDETFDCVNNAHILATWYPGDGLTEEQTHTFKSDFDAHDRNGDGMIDLYELNSFIDARGEPCSGDMLIDAFGTCTVEHGP